MIEENYAEDGKFKSVIKAFGISEDALNSRLDEISDTLKTVEIIVERNVLDLKIVIESDNFIDFGKAVKMFSESFPENIYADFEGTLQEVLVSMLKIGKFKISVAESFTGGNLASRIISVPGASEVFYEGIVAYSSEAKIRRLGVEEESIKKNKPVSSQVAGEMASGLLSEGVPDLVVSTTGLAGPSSDESGFPVGLCYLAAGSRQGVSVYRYMFDGTRAEITEKGVQTALFLAIKSVKHL